MLKFAKICNRLHSWDGTSHRDGRHRLLYAEDSFFTLGLGGRIGLVALTISMSAAMIFLVWYSVSGLKRVPRVLLAIAAFWLFVWLSPQLYYLYYQMIFDDLPWQIVVKSPPGPITIAQLLSFADRATLSSHGQGFLGWVLILTAIFRRRPR